VQAVARFNRRLKSRPKVDEQADPKPKRKLELLSEKVFFGVLPLVVLVCLAALGIAFYIASGADLTDARSSRHQLASVNGTTSSTWPASSVISN